MVEISDGFSVIVATYGRGDHILPTLKSALAQSYQDFEMIVVGDGPDEAMAQLIRELNDQRVSFHTLPERKYSQAFGNNFAISKASKRRIAYLGHDDIWQSNHLDTLNSTFETYGSDVVVSGCVFHQRSAEAPPFISGLFDNDQGAGAHFFPPTSFAHTRQIIDDAGPWVDPRKLELPTDQDLILRFQEAGAVLHSTSTITSHKFPAAERYLDLLMPTSDAQAELLNALNEGRFEQMNADWISASQKASRFMTIGFQNPQDYSQGELFAKSLTFRAAKLETRLLTDGQAVVLNGEAGACGVDWSQLLPNQLRFALTVKTPRILIPFRSAEPLTVWIAVCTNVQGGASSEAISFNGVPVPKQAQLIGSSQLGPVWTWCMTGQASMSAPSFVELPLPLEAVGSGTNYFAIGPIAVAAGKTPTPPQGYLDAVQSFTKASFPEEAYLQANPDVEGAILKGDFPNGFTHFLLHGRHERRGFCIDEDNCDCMPITVTNH